MKKIILNLVFILVFASLVAVGLIRSCWRVIRRSYYIGKSASVGLTTTSLTGKHFQ